MCGKCGPGRPSAPPQQLLSGTAPSPTQGEDGKASLVVFRVGAVGMGIQFPVVVNHDVLANLHPANYAILKVPPGAVELTVLESEGSLRFEAEAEHTYFVEAPRNVSDVRPEAQQPHVHVCSLAASARQDQYSARGRGGRRQGDSWTSRGEVIRRIAVARHRLGASFDPR